MEIVLTVVTIAVLYAGGYPAFKFFFKEENRIQAFFYSQVLGLIIVPLLVSALLLILPFRHAVSISLLAIMGTFLAVLLRNPRNFARPPIPRRDAIIGILSVIFFIFVLWINSNQNVLEFTDDDAWIAATASNIANMNTFPPENVCLTGTTVVYPWGPMVFLATVSSLVQANPLIVSNLIAPYFVMLFVAMSYLVGNHITGKQKGGIIAALLTAAVLLPIPFGPGNFVMPLVMLHICLLQSYHKEGGQKKLLLAGIIASTMIYLHALTFLFLSLVSFSYVLYMIVFEYGNAKRIWPLILAYVLALPYLYFSSLIHLDIQMFIFEPFALLIEFPYWHAYGILMLFTVLAVISPKINKKELHPMFAAIILVFVFSSTFIMTWSPNIDRSLDILRFYFILISAVFLSSMTNRKLSTLLIILTIFLFVSGNNGIIPRHYDNSEAEKILDVTSWLRDNTAANAVLLISPDEATTSTLYLALAERRAPLCHDMGLPSFFIDPYQRMEDVTLMYTKPSADLYEKYGIDNVLLCSKERKFFERYDIDPFDFKDSNAFKPVYSKSNCTVYSVDTTLLPQNGLPADRAALNFTFYSRWFQVYS